MQGAADDGRLSERVGDAATVREVFEAMPTVVVAMEGPQLRISAANRGFRTLVGRSHLIGLPLREAFADLEGQQVIEMYERVYATGEPLDQEGFRVQLDHAASGQRIELFFDFNLLPVRDEQGKVTGIVGSVRDVTQGAREHQAVQERAERAEQRYAEARDVITALQQELLPTGVPVLPGVQIAASYLLADTETAAGGDWFDALALPDGRAALVVGDVVGHGVSASAVMGQLRVLLHERLLATGEISAALSALDAAAARIPGARAATVCVALLDPGTGKMEYCTAGHPPPLVLPADGPGRYLPGTGASPLGTGQGEFVTRTDRLDPGEMALLYTDGILERPGREPSATTVELAQAAADIAADRAQREQDVSAADRVTGQTLELLTRVSGHSDDITLLAAHRVLSVEPFFIGAPAITESLSEIRREFGEWLTANRVATADASAAQHAVTELATNSMEHAHIDSARTHTVTISAELTVTGELVVRVADLGQWREPQPSPDRGLGLSLVRAMVDQLRIDHDEPGTTATVTHRLSWPAHLLTDRQSPYAGPGQPSTGTEPFLVLDQPSAPRPRIRADGPLDANSAAAFSAALQTTSATGMRSLTVDLTGLTHLASAGVSALFRHLADSRANGSELRLYAPAGTPAQTVLSLVQLPHTTTDPDLEPDAG